MILKGNTLDIHYILVKKFEDRKFSYDDAEGLTLFDKGPSITQENVYVAEKELIIEEAALLYRKKRAAAYPKIEDQLDFIVHNGITKYRTMMQAIKSKYPKPAV